MRKLTAVTVALGVTGVTLVGLAGAAGAAHPTGAAGAAQPAAPGVSRQADTDSPAAQLSGGAAEADETAPDAANGIIKVPASSYTSPSNQSVRVHALSPNTAVQTLCFTEGQIINNNFYRFRILHNGEVGFVHRDAIVPPGDLRHC